MCKKMAAWKYITTYAAYTAIRQDVLACAGISANASINVNLIRLTSLRFEVVMFAKRRRSLWYAYFRNTVTPGCECNLL